MERWGKAVVERVVWFRMGAEWYRVAVLEWNVMVGLRMVWNGVSRQSRSAKDRLGLSR